MATGAKASEVSDRMKEILYAKAAERVDLARPHVANSMFGQEFQPTTEDETESETEVEAEAETEVGDEVEQELETEEDSE
jgi:5'-3' exonuclease